MFFTACSSDYIVKEEKKEFVNMFKNLTTKNFSGPQVKTEPKETRKNNLWLSKFNQPIILISSMDKINQATLVALGNNKEKLTWVSSDGIGLSYDQGMLIGTRGYSQDLFFLKYKKPANIFAASQIKYNKIHRYLKSDNKYFDIGFECRGNKNTSKHIDILDSQLLVDTFVEECKSTEHEYVNEYDLLAGTTIVIKSKQWISPVNGYFLTYNYYAFQKF